MDLHGIHYLCDDVTARVLSYSGQIEFQVEYSHHTQDIYDNHGDSDEGGDSNPVPMLAGREEITRFTVYIGGLEINSFIALIAVSVCHMMLRENRR